MTLNIQIQTKIEMSQLLQGATQLTLSELESFVSELHRLIDIKKSIPKVRREKQLLARIQLTALDVSKRLRYKALAEKLEFEMLSEPEFAELAILTEEDDLLRNERVKYMIELAQLKQIPFVKLMEELGLKPIEYGK
jgi:hypothetical protein